MKNKNLLNWLWTDSHEKQSPQRFVRFAAMLIMLLTLGVGQMWSAELKNGQYIYINYSTTTWGSSSAKFKFNWYWNVGDYCCVNQEAGRVTGENYAYAQTQNEYTRAVQILRFNSTYGTQWNYTNTVAVSSNTKNCITLTAAVSDNYTFSWTTYAPPMSTVTLADNGTSIVSGSGTSGDPYLVYVSTPIKVSASGTKAVADPDATINYNFKQGSTSKQNGTGTTYQFDASSTPNTTYTLNLDGYTKVGSTSSSTKAATALYYKTIAAAEPTHDVTISYKYSSTTIKDATTESAVGESTARSITAPSIAGYTFSSWTKGVGVNITSGTTSTATISITTNSSGAYTLTANYTEDLSTTWYICGATGTNYPFTGWGTSGTRMSKKTGHSTEEIYYCTITVSTVATTDDHFPFKVYNSTGSQYYGNSGYWVTKENNHPTLSSTSGSNMKFRPYVTGTYEFKLDNTGANPVLTVTWPVFNQVRISAASPSDAGNVGNYDLSEPVSNVRTVTRSLKANTTYTFKIVYNSDWYGHGTGTFTRSNSTSSNSHTLITSSGNLTLTTDYAGDYTFRFNQSTKALSVDFPTAYKVTYGKGTVDGSTGSCSAKDIDNGNAAVTSNSTWVKSGNRVVLTAPAAKTGYTYDGWFDNNSGTGAAITTNANCTITVSSAETYYACYHENLTAVTITTDGHGTITTPNPNESPYSLGVATMQNINASANTGYHWNTWTVSGTAALNSSAATQSNKAKGDGTVGGTGTVTATFSPNTYRVHFHRNGGAGEPVYQSFTYDVAQNLTANSYTKTGYSFAGWALSTGGDVKYANSANVSNLTAENGVDFHLYAKWTPNPYTVVLDKQTSAEGYGSEGTVANQTVTFDATPATVSGTMPSAANGYAFMGFYSATGGNGRLFIDPSGNWVTSAGDTISGGNWVKPAGITLYAYYKKAEITDVELNGTMFDPVAAGDEGYVVANPTIAPNPTGDHIICWELLYDNDNPVIGHNPIADPDGSHLNRIKFSIAGLAAGGYKIRTTLRTGSSCAGGTLLDTRITTFQIANAFTVTVEYKDREGNTIAASTTSPGKALESTDITAPDLIGYTFSTWQLGEGMSTEEALTTKTDFSYKTTFNSTLTAVYTKKNVIYFNNTLGWEDVWVYFYTSNKYWANDWGTGAWRGQYFDGSRPYYNMHRGHMTQIEGTNIWYFDYTAKGWDGWENVAFTNMGDQTGQGANADAAAPDNDHAYFSNTTDNPIQVVRRGDHKTTLPMFVPLTGQTGTLLNNKKANYVNQGYWMNYPENTGYVLHIYNSKTYGASDELMSIPFEFNEDKTMPMSLTVELAGGKEYGFEIHRADGNNYGTDTKVMKNGDSGDDGAGWALAENKRTGLLTSVAGDYTFTLNFGNRGGGYNFLAGVHYPVAANDYRVVYNDRVAWSQGTAHSASWYHPSRAINKKDGAEDIVSFYVSKEVGANASMKFQYASAVSGEGVVTWSDVDGGSISLSDITESGVYNFYLSQAAGSITVDSIRPYTGQYYIRSQAVTGGWDNYRVGSDHKMTYSEFSESAANTFGEKFSHYKAKWCPRNTNIAFTIANDYSMCITDTLKQDVGNPYGNTDADGKLNNDGNPGHDGSNAYLDPNSANVRFMWNRKTNKISRAYVASSTSTEARFLVLQGSGTANANIFDENGSALSANPPGANATLLRDDQNWIYEITVQANPSALVKLYATYKGIRQYFRGTSDPGFEKGTSAVELLGGTSSSARYSVRVVYDFKTNRLVTAWQPTGATQEIDGVLNINADVMVVRSHHESAQCITFANDESALNGVKTVYGVMQFNRWILNNRENPEDDTPEHCADLSAIATHHRPLAIGDQKSIYERSHYYISFPFDVKLSDVFGFGQYWNEWYIEWYDGLTRAQNGYWIDSPSNWKYVTPEEKDNFVLKANQGYILGLDMDYMQATDFSFWSNKNTTIELYFPSTVSLETLKSTEVTIPALNTIEGDPYRCTINRENGDDGDRRIKDSYWRCIGVPSFNIYNSALEDGKGNMIEWKDNYEWKEDDAAFPFIYLWNKADNTITPQATSEFSFQPMHAYLVQNGGAIVWSAVSAKPSSIVARQRNTEPEEYNWRLELQQNNQMIDRTYIRMKDLESVTDGFDFGQDMSKEFNKKRSAIFSFIGTEKVAANSMPVHTEQTTIVPLGLDIKSAGEYVISLPEGTNGVGVVLVDSITGTRTNLGLMDYEVSLTAGKIDNRFLLEISPIVQTPTDIENVQGDNVQGTKVRKVMVDGILYIVKDGKVFDARGAKVK